MDGGRDVSQHEWLVEQTLTALFQHEYHSPTGLFPIRPSNAPTGHVHPTLHIIVKDWVNTSNCIHGPTIL